MRRLIVFCFCFLLVATSNIRGTNSLILASSSDSPTASKLIQWYYGLPSDFIRDICLSTLILSVACSLPMAFLKSEEASWFLLKSSIAGGILTFGFLNSVYSVITSLLYVFEAYHSPICLDLKLLDFIIIALFIGTPILSFIRQANSPEEPLPNLSLFGTLLVHVFVSFFLLIRQAEFFGISQDSMRTRHLKRLKDGNTGCNLHFDQFEAYIERLVKTNDWPLIDDILSHADSLKHDPEDMIRLSVFFNQYLKRPSVLRYALRKFQPTDAIHGSKLSKLLKFRDATIAFKGIMDLLPEILNYIFHLGCNGAVSYRSPMDALTFGWATSLIFKGISPKDHHTIRSHYNKVIGLRNAYKDTALIADILYQHRKSILIAGGLKLVSEILSVLSVQVMRYAAQMLRVDREVTDVVFPLLLLMTMQILNTFLMNHHEFIMCRIGLTCSRSIVNQVYNRLLIGGSEAELQEGNMVNLMTVDANRVEHMFGHLHYIWSAPLQCTLIFWSIYGLIGAYSLIGIILMILYIPVQYCLAHLLKSMRQSTLRLSDERVSQLGGVLDRFKIIKTLCLEALVYSRLYELRSIEASSLKRYHLMRGLSQMVNFLFIVLATSGTIAALLLRSDGLGAVNLVMVVALFKLLRVQLNMIPMSVNALADGMSSLRRFQSKLQSPHELVSDCVQDGEYFRVLHEGRVYEIPRGKIISLEGSLPSCSGFLRSALAQLTPSVKVGYCPSSPWLMNTNILANITLGHDHDPKRLSTTLSLCQLDDDLNRIPLETMVSRNGCNLSGGQRQRISLARVVYSDASVWLIDDIFAALDTDTAKSILENCIAQKPDDITGILVGQSEYSNVTINLCSSLMSYSSSRLSLISQNPTNKESHHVDMLPAAVVEDPRVGQLDKNTVTDWIRMNGGLPFILACLLLLFMINQCRIGSELFVSEYRPGKASNLDTTIYAAFTVGQVLLPFFMTALFSLCGLSASTRLHMSTIKNIIRAPLLKHTETSASILLNRSGRDQESVDNGLIVSAAAFAVMAGVLFFTSLAILSKNWRYTSLPLALTLGLYTLLSLWYRRAMREAKRQEAAARTPICSRASELATGLPIIKGLHKEAQCSSQLAELIDHNASFRFLLLTCQVWFTLRIELIGALLTFFVGLGAALSGMQPALAGLLLSYCGSLSGLTMWTIRQLAHTETNLIAWRRLTALQEDFQPELTDGALVSLNGPVSMELCNLKATIGSTPILRDVNTIFAPSSRTCIIGRTGSGKSSLLLMLLRVLPVEKGKILINGIDIEHLSIESLRSLVDYVPQEALLFEGETLRFNLDPTGIKSDADLWAILQCLRVEGYTLDFILPCTCPMYIKELILLGRSLARGNSLLLMDEPMASLPSSHLRTILSGPHFMALLQGKTVVMVTHRPQLIDFCDKTLRLVDGQLRSS